MQTAEAFNAYFITDESEINSHLKPCNCINFQYDPQINTKSKL